MTHHTTHHTTNQQMPSGMDTVMRCQTGEYIPEPDRDSTRAYLALCIEDINTALAHLKAASRDPLVDESLGTFTIEALRGIRDAIEAELADAQD